MLIFKSKQKKFEGDLKIKLSGKRLYPTESVKYFGVKIDTNLSWQYHVDDLSIKLNRANALLSKIRKFVSLKILRSIYFAIFDFYLSYCCLVWAHNYSTIQCIIILQKKAIRIINLQPRKTLFYSIQYKNLLKYKPGCSWPFSCVYTINFYVLYCHIIKEYRCLKNAIHQLERNEWLLLSAFQQGLHQKLVFVVKQENAFL